MGIYPYCVAVFFAVLPYLVEQAIGYLSSLLSIFNYNYERFHAGVSTASGELNVQLIKALIALDGLSFLETR